MITTFHTNSEAGLKEVARVAIHSLGKGEGPAQYSNKAEQ